MSDDARPSRKAYKLPTQTPGGEHTNEALLKRLCRFETWCGDLGVRTQGTRIERYRRYLENFRGFHEELDRGIFLDPPESPIRHALDRYLYVLREVHELTWISQSLGAAEVKGMASKLAKVISGADFAALDRNSESRNTQFELRIASYFARSGFQLNLETETDVVAIRQRVAYHVECKRIASGKQVERRLKEAVQQLRVRVPRSTWRNQHVALVAADVTKVAFTRNGLTMAITPDHSRDVVQAALVAIRRRLERSGALDLNPACALWLQIHIPSLILTPPAPVTRFSNFIIRNERGGWAGKRASDRFWRMFHSIDTSEPGDTPPRPLRPRQSIAIPTGTKIAPDLKLLEHIASTRQLPELTDEHVVLSVTPPGGADEDCIDFSFFEFRWIFDSLNPAARLEFEAPESALRALVGCLLLRRFPYVGEPQWLDGPH